MNPLLYGSLKPGSHPATPPMSRRQDQHACGSVSLRLQLCDAICIRLGFGPAPDLSRAAQVVVPLPDEAGRAAILAVHMRGVPLARELDPAAVCELISKMTRGAWVLPAKIRLASSQGCCVSLQDWDACGNNEDAM